MNRKNCLEKVMQIVFLICACVSVLCVALICIFLFANGIPAIGKIGVGKFLLGDIWRPSNQLFGIFPFILGSIYVTAGAIIVGVPIGILTAVFLAKFCPKRIYRFLKTGVELMAGIPSVVYGFFGLMVLVPFIRDNFREKFGGNGLSILTAAILLGIMILPVYPKRRFVLYRINIIWVLWHWAQHMNVAYSVQLYRQLNQVLWQELYWELVVRLVKRWRLLW